MSRKTIAVMSCTANKERRDAIRNTWFKDVPSHVGAYFFVGGDGCADAECLPCGDAYEDCWVKQFELIRKVCDHDYAFFCDDDTYVVPERLLAIDLDGVDYMGCPCVFGHGTLMAQGGAGFWMSHRAMESAVWVGLDHPRFEKTIYSDRTVGSLMEIVGIPLKPDFRFNLGKYDGDRGFCNLVPNKQNAYITTHFVTPENAAQIYAHFHEDKELPPNRYTMNLNGTIVWFSELNGKWWYFTGRNNMFIGEFPLAQDAEFHAVSSIRNQADSPATP